MATKKWIFPTALILFFGIVFLIFRPVPIPYEGDCLIVDGHVAQIYESGTKDVSIRLEGNDKIFYVNRGLERGLDLNELNDMLIGEKILIKYPKYWTPLDPGSTIRHISKIEFNGRTIFTELSN